MRSTLSNLAAKKEDAVDEAKQKIDRILARLNYPYGKRPASRLARHAQYNIAWPLRLGSRWA